MAPEQAPDTPAYVTIGFEKGVPVSLDGKAMDGVSLIKALNKIGGAERRGHRRHGGNRLVGMKSRGVYENPGGAILYQAHRVLETITLDRDTQHYKAIVAERYAELVYFGQWFTPLREALDAFVNVTQQTVSGSVQAQALQGQHHQRGRHLAVFALLRAHRILGDDQHAYDQKNAAGFITLFGLPIAVRASMQQETEK